ncbi:MULTISPECIES: type I restriction enzyme HsdR N-terminal domain-containing protein [unclassified Fibrobacter]|uniref:type I restriction enzyme HsdR N-terminal domain-containing protein n=1 Tax=unclassified Fibrobacter TaxID=2634177 RepID=UPI0025C445B1|nr:MULTISPECIES: type I restriction enzyme HsdR N-terminal domain-containing protein [unclassified Fibrobacter]
MTHGTIYDPIRRKDVPDTPEEHVRQATVQFLLNEIKVPAHLITVEFGLCAIDPKTDDRVDIIVSNFREGAALDKPWLLVECKAPGEYTWEALQVQLNRYLKVLTPKFVMLALGDAVRYFERDDATGRFKKIEKLPDFK